MNPVSPSEVVVDSGSVGRYGGKAEDRRAGEADLTRTSGRGRSAGYRRARHPDDAQEKATVFQGSGPGRGGADRGRSVGCHPASYRDSHQISSSGADKPAGSLRKLIWQKLPGHSAN